MGLRFAPSLLLRLIFIKLFRFLIQVSEERAGETWRLRDGELPGVQHMKMERSEGGKMFTDVWCQTLINWSD